MRNLATALLALSCLAVPVGAQELMRYDVDAECRTLASYGGAFSELTFRGCMDMEQAAYNYLRQTWAGLPAHIRQSCNELAAYGGNGSYLTLKGCVEMEMNAAAQNRTRTFQY